MKPRPAVLWLLDLVDDCLGQVRAGDVRVPVLIDEEDILAGAIPAGRLARSPGSLLVVIQMVQR